MGDKKSTALDAIVQQGVLPLFYSDSNAISAAIIKALYEGGIRVIEYTNRGKNALANLSSLKSDLQQLPDLLIGVGTIKTKQEAEEFIHAGADFLVSPVVSPQLGEFLSSQNLLWIPGCATPSEIQQATDYRADLVKLFPAHLLGPKFVRSVREVFPGQLFVPTGGVGLSADDMKEWFSAGVCAVGAGSNFINVKEASEEYYNDLRTRSAMLLKTINDIRS